MFQRKRKASDFSAEIEAHVQLESERLQDQGLSAQDAQAAARRAFGNVMHTEERFYESHRWVGWDHLLQDLRFGLRMLARNPGFTITVVLTLALSIGANTAIFSIVNALLLKSLPYPHPERLGAIYARTTGPDAYDMRRNVDGEQWELLRDNVPSLLSAISSLRTAGVNFQAGSRVEYLQSGRVSQHYFEVLGVHPILGRNFSEDEDRPHGPKAAILSYALWRSAFAANPGLLGQTVLLRGEPHTIVGVLPQNATTPLNADVYIPLQATRDGEGMSTNFQAITRLRDAANWQQADAEMNRAWAKSTRVQHFLSSNPGAQITYYSVPLQKGETAALQPEVLSLMLSAGFILLIACANLAGLTLVRMLRRSAEIATRAALGASSWQIQRQLWIENLLLALVGGLAGIGVGFLALRGLLLLLPEHFLPVAKVSLDNRVLVFTLAMSVLTSVLFGILPTLSSRKINLRASLASRAVTAGGIRLRQGLIAGEVALTVVLLAAAGLLIRTLIHLETLPPGFNPNGVLTAKASLVDVRYNDPAAFRKLLDQSIAALRAIPGVQNAAVGLTLPYERALLSGVVLSNGKAAGQEVTTNQIYVTPGYFETLQIPLLAGRTFTDADGPDAQPVLIVNQTFARKFLGADPVGLAVSLPFVNQGDNHRVIVGVVADTVMSSAAKLNTGSEPLTSEEAVYIPAAQIIDGKSLAVTHAWFQPSWIVRTARPVDGLTGQMQLALATVDPNLPFSGFYDMKDLMSTTLTTQRIQVVLLVAMASLALLLSAVGIFALVANIVAQRTREIGIRMALGSTVQRTMTHIGASGVGAAAIGLSLGLVLCVGALPAMRSVVYGVGVYDTPTMLLVIVTLGVVALLATTVPTLRVARIDPAKTLRVE